MHVDDQIRRIVGRIKEHLVGVHREHLREVILYGSFARGEENPYSDIDVLVVIDDSLDPSEVRKELGDLILDILLEEGELVSVVVVNEGFFEKSRFPFVLNVKEEGVIV